jgi:hypothetical protein
MESPSQPTMQTFPSSRATTAAWDVLAPSAAINAAASDSAPMFRVLANEDDGLFPLLHAATRSGSKTAAPIATPVLAGVPRASGGFNLTSSMPSSSIASIRASASPVEMSPSSARFERRSRLDQRPEGLRRASFQLGEVHGPPAPRDHVLALGFER